MADQRIFEHSRQLFLSAREALRPILPKRLLGDVPLVPVVRLSGVIGLSTPLKPGLTLANVARPLERAFGMRKARAIALLINSPGGSPVQSHLIYRRIRQLAAEKKVRVIAFAEDVAASGGYMIACAADEIICDSSSIVGSRRCSVKSTRVSSSWSSRAGGRGSRVWSKLCSPGSIGRGARQSRSAWRMV
jgi:ClpP class serine protease